MSTEVQGRETEGALEINLRGVDGRDHSLSSLKGAVGTVVVFVGNGCPTARAYEDRLMRLQEACQPKGISLVAINSNNPSLSPPDTLAEMVTRARSHKFNFPYLKDADSAAAKIFGAICTPHAFLVDHDFRVAYSGRIDDSRMGNTITSRDLDNAITDLVANRPVAVPQTEPFGCSIVW